MGHRVSKDGLSIDPSKVSSMRGINEPGSPEELRRFLGLVNYLAKSLPNTTVLIDQLAEEGRPVELVIFPAKIV